MALGVLNNLSAIYAENNLNNTSNSLQKVLQQLSSGSRINSGADDAAGLSLVNGLQANQSALMQSETNATEGVGLLDVADGALSQVTSLLDRAITLATEASNGTLNATQDAAANQEYQSILAEVNNIGSTTTYNQQQVFSGNVVAIYTGDSSIAGSSVDDLNIRTLSSSSIGDTNGAMTYSSGANNVFIDLSNGGHNASVSDSLNASGTTTVNVNYATKGAGGAATQATAAITVGTGTGYANTVNGLISAINQAGLGLTATFGTAAEAGTAAAATASAASCDAGRNIEPDRFHRRYACIESGYGQWRRCIHAGLAGDLPQQRCRVDVGHHGNQQHQRGGDIGYGQHCFHDGKRYCEGEYFGRPYGCGRRRRYGSRFNSGDDDAGFGHCAAYAYSIEECR